MPADTKQPRHTKPRVNANGAKSPTIAFRVRGDLYDRLKASAEARGYSLSEEIEHRLNRSMDTAGDHFAEMALQLIADNWRAIQSLSGRKMVDDKFTLQACCEAAYKATELLAGVNGMDLRVGLLGDAMGEGVNVEAGKQLGRAIVYHRELLHMKDPPEQAVEVYGSAVVDAMAKRIAHLKDRVAERPVPAGQDAPSAPDPLAYDAPNGPPVRLIGEEAAATLAPGMKAPRGMLPGSIHDQAIADEAIAGLPLEKAERQSIPKVRKPRALQLDDVEPAEVPLPKPRKRALQV